MLMTLTAAYSTSACFSWSRYTAKERDTESGLDYFNARYLSSNSARMLSPDPLGGSLLNPQSLNKYAYAFNNPLTNTDPTGLYVCKDSAKCDSKQDKAFEKSRQKNLKSKNKNVVRGAKVTLPLRNVLHNALG